MDRQEQLILATRVAQLADERAFARLVDEYQGPVRRFFLSQTLGDKQLSDDLAQDTFIKAFTHMGQYQGKSSLLTWLYRIAYNTFYDYTRRQRPTADLDSPATARLAASSASSDLRMDLYEALELLSPNERTCITLQLIEGQPLDKIAEITGMPAGTVKSHLSRGKKHMAEHLRKNGYS